MTQSEKNRAYYLKNRERIRARQAEYRQGDDYKLYRKVYYAANFETMRENWRAYYHRKGAAVQKARRTAQKGINQE